MKSKLLPLPLGGRAPRGSSIRFWQQYGFRARADSVALGAGLGLAAAGAWMGLHQEPIQVGLDGSGYHLGASTLVAVDAARYSGDVAMVIHREGGQVKASAAGRLAGKQMQGRCTLVIGAGREECTFVVDSHGFHAHDDLSNGTWRRTYDDGVRVEIKVANPRDPVPVPVPVGHR